MEKKNLDISKETPLKFDPMTSAEKLIDKMEKHATLFSLEERNLIMNYAYQLGDMDKVKELANTLAEEQFGKKCDSVNPEVKKRIQAEIDYLPDNSVNITHMIHYGYSDYKAMYPLSKGTAIELFEKQSLAIYRLYPDGTESMIHNLDDIKTFDGIFGVERVDWDNVKKTEALENKKFSYYVAECMEYENLGTVQDNIPTIEEAIKIFQQLPDDSKIMGNGIGAEIDGYHYPLYDSGEIVMKKAYFPDEVKIPEIQRAVDVLKSTFPLEKTSLEIKQMETVAAYGNTPSIFEEVTENTTVSNSGKSQNKTNNKKANHKKAQQTKKPQQNRESSSSKKKMHSTPKHKPIATEMQQLVR